MSPASPAHRFPAAAAGLAGLTGVALGAMGAHAWKAALVARGTLDSWHTAANYHLLHAVALLGLAAWLRAVAPAAPATLVWAARCWVAGIVLFSGSIYWLAHGGPRWLGPVTPLGGVAFMIGWLLLVVAALRRDPAG